MSVILNFLIQFLLDYFPRFGHYHDSFMEYMDLTFPILLLHHTACMCTLPVSLPPKRINYFMVRSVFSIFIIKKCHYSQVVHVIYHDYFFFQIFLLSLELILFF